jgi:hypothetical protein
MGLAALSTVLGAIHGGIRRLRNPISEVLMPDPTTPAARLVQAHWVNELAWFWECDHCLCAFGPLTNAAGARTGADEHDDERHSAVSS